MATDPYLVPRLRMCDENFVLLGYYAASSGCFLPMFWDYLSVSAVLNVDKKSPLLAA
jgi:hypothetical protein